MGLVVAELEEVLGHRIVNHTVHDKRDYGASRGELLGVPYRPLNRSASRFDHESMGTCSSTMSDVGLDQTPSGEVLHLAARGAIASMAMSGMRTVTVHFGLVEETPPEAIFRQRAHGLLRKVPRSRRKAVIELVHWGYGAAGGAVLGLLPESVRRAAWAGPIYGIVLWGGFEAGIAPALGLSQAHRPRPVERLALAADHLLYGFVLSELRSRPRR
jgi:hypothetical protein